MKFDFPKKQSYVLPQIRVTPEIHKQIRVIAAERQTSMGSVQRALIEAALGEYAKKRS